MLEQKTIAIGESSYTIESLPATEALALLAELSDMLGGLGEGVKDIPSARTEISSAIMSGSLDLGQMLQGLLKKLDPEKTPALIKRITKSSIKKWQDADDTAYNDWYENHFSRKQVEQFQLLYAILEWNYGDSVDWIKKMLVKVLTIPAGEESEAGSQEQSTQ